MLPPCMLPACMLPGCWAPPKALPPMPLDDMPAVAIPPAPAKRKSLSVLNRTDLKKLCIIKLFNLIISSVESIRYCVFNLFLNSLRIIILYSLITLHSYYLSILIRFHISERLIVNSDYRQSSIIFFIVLSISMELKRGKGTSLREAKGPVAICAPISPVQRKPLPSCGI